MRGQENPSEAQQWPRRESLGIRKINYDETLQAYDEGLLERGEKLKTALVVVGWLAILLAVVSLGLMGALLTDTAPAVESALWMVGEALFPALVGGQFLFVGLLLLVLGRELEELARIRMALETRAG